MVPHILGWFPMSAVWFILINQLEQAKRDVAEVSDSEIPSWVNALIYGTALIFMSFAAVSAATLNIPTFYRTPSSSDGIIHSHSLRDRSKSSSNVTLAPHSNLIPEPLCMCLSCLFHAFPLHASTGLAPGFYFGSEIAYCILSLTAKMYLGWFLLINVRAFVWLVHVVCTQPNAIPLQVLYVDGSTADETLQGAGAGAR